MYMHFSSPERLAGELLAAADANTLWLLCIADCHGHQVPDLLAACRANALRVCGGLFPGLIDGAATRDSGLIAIALPAASRMALADLKASGVTWRLPPPALAGDASASSTILVDCLAPHITGLLEDIYDRYGNRISHVGAGTGYHDLRPAPSIFTEQGSHRHAALLVITPQPATVQVRHGWKRVMGPFVASRTQGNIIQELNWQPAGSFYRDQVVSHDPSYAGHPIFPDINSAYPFCISKEGGEDVIRDPIRLTAADEIVALSDVTENSVLYLAHGNRQSLIDAARLAVEDCGRPPDVERCFVSDCYSRALMLGNAFAQELAAVSRAVAQFTDSTPEGVLALGEIAANGQQNLELLNKTIVVALTHRQTHE